MAVLSTRVLFFMKPRELFGKIATKHTTLFRRTNWTRYKSCLSIHSVSTIVFLVVCLEFKRIVLSNYCQYTPLYTYGHFYEISLNLFNPLLQNVDHIVGMGVVGNTYTITRSSGLCAVVDAGNYATNSLDQNLQNKIYDRRIPLCLWHPSIKASLPFSMPYLIDIDRCLINVDPMVYASWFSFVHINFVIWRIIWYNNHSV